MEWFKISFSPFFFLEVDTMKTYLQATYDLTDPNTVTVFDELSLWSSRFGTFLLDHLEIRKNLKILDLGCGLGFPLFELAHIFGITCHVIGVDVWKEALERARAKLRIYDLPNVEILEADGAQLPFCNEAFDLIVSNLGINNFSDPKAVLSECHRVLKPAGKVILTTNPKGHMLEFYEVFREVLGQHNQTSSFEKLDSHENHRISRNELSDLLHATGFQVENSAESSFKLRFADGTTMLNHFLIKVGFLDGWRGVVEPDSIPDVFDTLERRLNEIAEKNGELSMTIPMLYLEGKKN